MNTFLPFPSFAASVAVLDDQRLGKQRLECRQLLDTLRGRSQAWVNHPCTRMWRSHEWQLCQYAIQACLEWRKRGFKDSMLDEFTMACVNLVEGPNPPWLGSEGFHSSMRANLIRKDPKRYRDQLGWTEAPQEGYAWPS